MKNFSSFFSWCIKNYTLCVIQFTTLRMVPNYDVSKKNIRRLSWMGASKVNRNKNTVGEQQGPLVGTWISVGVVGAVILATYILLFGLFMARF